MFARELLVCNNRERTDENIFCLALSIKEIYCLKLITQIDRAFSGFSANTKKAQSASLRTIRPDES